MLCPYCRIEYTDEQPCFCQPPATAQKAEPNTLKSQKPKGYFRALSALREGNSYRLRLEVFRHGNASEVPVPHTERYAIARISLHRGLCSTCRSDLTCTYPRNPWRPVTECEEFDGELTAPRNPTDRSDSRSASLELRS